MTHPAIGIQQLGHQLVLTALQTNDHEHRRVHCRLTDLAIDQQAHLMIVSQRRLDR